MEAVAQELRLLCTLDASRCRSTPEQAAEAADAKMDKWNLLATFASPAVADEVLAANKAAAQALYDYVGVPVGWDEMVLGV